MFASLQNYKDTMQTQVLESAGRQGGRVMFGADLPQEKLSQFQDEQIGQLYELMLESTKPNKQFDIHEDGRWRTGPQKMHEKDMLILESQVIMLTLGVWRQDSRPKDRL